MLMTWDLAESPYIRLITRITLRDDVRYFLGEEPMQSFEIQVVSWLSETFLGGIETKAKHLVDTIGIYAHSSLRSQRDNEQLHAYSRENKHL